MGGSSKSDQIDPAMQNITPVTPPWLAGATPLVLPQGAPGQLSSLAAQLAKGGYGAKKANLAWLDRTYGPVHTLQLPPPPPPPAKKPAAKPSTNPVDDPLRRWKWQGGSNSR